MYPSHTRTSKPSSARISRYSDAKRRTYGTVYLNGTVSLETQAFGNPGEHGGGIAP